MFRNISMFIAKEDSGTIQQQFQTSLKFFHILIFIQWNNL